MTPTRPRPAIFPLAAALGLLAFSAATPAPVPKGKEPTTPYIKWHHKSEFRGNDPHDPLVVSGLVIVGTDRGELRAYRCDDGKEAWAHKHGSRIFHSPTTDGERVFFTSSAGVTAVAVKDGAKLWSYDLAACDGPTLALPRLGLVYVGGHDGQLHALEAKTGRQRWTSDFVTDAPPDQPNFPGANARMQNTRARPTALASDGEAIFLSVFDQSRLVAVSAKTGKRLWALQTNGWVYGTAVATAKHVYVGSYDKAVYAVDRKSGKQAWKYETGRWIASGGVVDEQHVYIASCDGNLYALGQPDGKKRWQFAADAGPGGRPTAIYSVPVLRGDTLTFAAGEGTVYAVDRNTGKMRWKVRPSAGSEAYCSPAAEKTTTFVVTRAASRGVGEASLVAIGLK